MSSAFVRVVTDTEAVPSPPPQPALVTGYEPDRFQKFAIEAIEAIDGWYSNSGFLKPEFSSKAMA